MAIKGNVEQFMPKELNQIRNPELRACVQGFFDTAVPNYFWRIPASSTGKYHPIADAGDGGLVRHTRMAVAFGVDFVRIEDYAAADPDMVIAALMMHDTFKNGVAQTPYTVQDHGLIAAEQWMSYMVDICSHNPEISPETRSTVKEIADAITWHMGQWSGVRIEEECGEMPRTALVKAVQLADYASSRKCIDMFSA